MLIRKFKQSAALILCLSLTFSLYAQDSVNPDLINQEKAKQQEKEKENKDPGSLRSGRTENVKSAEQQEVVKEFRGTRFLQLDKLILNDELKKHEDEFSQNIIDSVISSKTHTHIFSQRRPEGYSSAYTNFYGIEIELKESPTDPSKLDLRLFYYNWTTNKSDKELKKQISKFNVLNELRFSLYELLNGKDFVRDNYNRIQRHNYNRIKAIRQIVEEKEKKAREALPKKKVI